MRDITLGQYYPVQSPVHKLDPRTKLFGTLVLIVALFVADNVYCYGAAALFLFGIIAASKVPVGHIVKGLKPVLFLLVFSAAFNLFLTPGEELVHFWIFTITKEGLVRAGMMAVRLTFLVIRQINGTSGSENNGLPWHGHADGGSGCGSDAAGIFQGNGTEIIGPVFTYGYTGMEMNGRAAGNHMKETQIVYPDVQQCSAAQARIEFPVFSGPFGYKTVVAADVFYIPDFPGLYDLLHALKNRQKANPEGFHDKKSFFLSQLIKGAGFTGRDGKGLFAEHVFAGLQAESGILIVKIVGCTDIHGFHLRVCTQFLVGAVSPGNMMGLGKLLCLLQVSGAHGS